MFQSLLHRPNAHCRWTSCRGKPRPWRPLDRRADQRAEHVLPGSGEVNKNTDPRCIQNTLTWCVLDLCPARAGQPLSGFPQVAEHNWRGIEPARRTNDMVVDQALATVQEAPFIVDVLRAADDLALAAARNGGHRATEV